MSRLRACAVALPAFVLVLILSITLTARMDDRFPEGTGKAETVKVCSGCHPPETVLANSLTATEWSAELDKMATMGARATDDEWRLIEAYLDAKLALIKINAATVDELKRTMEVSDEIAAAIVKRREEKGSFKTLDDLKRVSGLDAAIVNARKDRLVF